MRTACPKQRQRRRASGVIATSLALLALAGAGVAAEGVAAEREARPVAASGASAAIPATDHAEARLRALRNALSAATLKAPLAVRSTAWVDESGRLHENTRVESGVQLRGVRVLAYLEKDGELEARLADDAVTALPAAWRGQACDPMPARYRRSVAVSVTETSRGIEGYGFLGTLARQVERQALSMASADRNAFVFAEAQQASTYDRALLPATANPESQYRLTLEVSPERPGANPFVVTLPFRETFRTWGLDVDARTLPSRPFHVRLVLTERVTGRVVLADHWGAELPEAGMDLAARSIPPALQQALHEKLDEWKAAVSKALTCEPVRLQVAVQSAEQLDLQAGALQGVRAGDQFVLVDADRVPNQMLEAGALDAASLWEVQSIGAVRATAKRLAGPGPAIARRWVALPH